MGEYLKLVEDTLGAPKPHDSTNIDFSIPPMVRKEKAKSLGLQNFGFGRWGKDGKVLYRTSKVQGGFLRRVVSVPDSSGGASTAAPVTKGAEGLKTDGVKKVNISEASKNLLKKLRALSVASANSIADGLGITDFEIDVKVQPGGSVQVILSGDEREKDINLKITFEISVINADALTFSTNVSSSPHAEDKTYVDKINGISSNKVSVATEEDIEKAQSAVDGLKDNLVSIMD